MPGELDERGSELFEHICELPEYYPTRTEMAILEASAPAIVDAVAPVELVELGSGATAKARLLLDAMDGVGADADVTFVLTTNRADILETALADRPGRVDLAIEREQAELLRSEGVRVWRGHVREPIPWWEGPQRPSRSTRSGRSSG